MFFIGLAWKNHEKSIKTESRGLCNHSDTFPWPRDIIFEGFKVFENFDFSESKILPWNFSEYDKIFIITKICRYNRKSY